MKKINRNMVALFLAAEIASTGFLASCSKNSNEKVSVEIPKETTSYFSNDTDRELDNYFVQVDLVPEVLKRLNADEDLLNNEDMINLLSRLQDMFEGGQFFINTDPDVLGNHEIYAKLADGQYGNAVCVLSQTTADNECRYYVGMYPSTIDSNSNVIYEGYNIYKNLGTGEFREPFISRNNIICNDDELLIYTDSEWVGNEVKSYNVNLHTIENIDGEDDLYTPLSITLTTPDYFQLNGLDEGVTSLIYVNSEYWNGTKIIPISDEYYSQLTSLITDGKDREVISAMLRTVSENTDEHEREYASTYLNSNFVNEDSKALTK